MKLENGIKVRRVGNMPMEYIDKLLEAIREEDWDKNNYRKKAGGMVDVDTIPILHTSKCAYAGDTMDAINDIHKETDFDYYFPFVKPMIQELKKYYTFNKYATFMAKLIPGGNIRKHKDVGRFLELCHRVHIPLKSNPDVGYFVDGKRYYWEPGNIYEFDNTLNHSVQNYSKEDRIHLLVNLYNTKSWDLENVEDSPFNI